MVLWSFNCLSVPGKSANDCFNKVHSNQSTPREAQPRSRANKLKSSPLGNFSLSASKLLKPTDQNTNKNKRSYNKKKSHIGQRTVRHLLRKHYNVNQDHEVDLFSVLEPNIESSTKKLTQSILFSTPKHKMGKSGLVQRFNDRSSSSGKKPHSRFSNLRPIPVPLVSPPVLKEVKNRALHDKYIDHLHNRDAKRKVASERNGTSIFGLKSMHNYSKKIDVVKANLVSNAKDIINQLKHLQANDSVNSSDRDDDVVGTNTDDEHEDGRQWTLEMHWGNQYMLVYLSG